MLSDSPETKGLRVDVVAQSASPGLATVIRACLETGSEVRVFIPDRLGGADNEHEVGFPPLASCPKITLTSKPDFDEGKSDLFLATWSHSLRYPPDWLPRISKAAKQSRKSWLLYANQFGSQRDLIIQQAKELVKYRTPLGSFQNCLCMLLPPRLDLFSLLFRKVSLSVGPNIHYLFEPEAEQNLYQPFDPESPRPLKLFGSGAKNSSNWRSELVEHLEGVIRQKPVSIIQDIPTPGQKADVVWTLGHRRPSLPDYVKLLSSSDFTLCIPGTSWTHRPFEALARGSIPILDSLLCQMHDFPWRDGENCILIPDQHSRRDWENGVFRALEMSGNKIVEMRRNIASELAPYVNLPSFCARLFNKLNLSTS